jgi:hypothetical protein
MNKRISKFRIFEKFHGIYNFKRTLMKIRLLGGAVSSAIVLDPHRFVRRFLSYILLFHRTLLEGAFAKKRNNIFGNFAKF